VAVLLLLVFLADLIAGEPFGGGPFLLVDIAGTLGSILLGYLAWDAAKDLK
jgi:hypothetical protein